MSTRGPIVDQERRHALDLRGTVVVDSGPGHAEPFGQFRSQCRLVEHPGGFLGREQLTAVEGKPSTVCRADLVGNEDVGVELGVSGTRRPVDKARREESFGVDLEDTIVPAAGPKECAP